MGVSLPQNSKRGGTVTEEILELLDDVAYVLIRAEWAAEKGHIPTCPVCHAWMTEGHRKSCKLDRAMLELGIPDGERKYGRRTQANEVEEAKDKCGWCTAGEG